MTNVKYECIELPWDTEFFGKKSARVNILATVNESEQRDILDFCSKYQFITISNENNLSDNNYWIGMRTNSFLVDLNVRFQKEVKTKDYIGSTNTYIQNNLTPNEQIIKISKEAFKYSRFDNDPHLKFVSFKDVYTEWTKNSFCKSDKYFVVNEVDKNITGYLIFKMSTNGGQIELIAVDKKYQGLGVGSSLIAAMEEFMVNLDAKSIIVGTQINNYSAIDFYFKNGFKYIGCNSVYHLWNK